MTDKQIDRNNQVEVGLNIAKELLELHKIFEDEVEKNPYVIQTDFIKSKLFYFYQRADWLNVCFKLLEQQLSRKEQECEEWQKEVERIQFIGSYGILDEVKKNIKLEEQLDQLKADNRILKEKFEIAIKNNMDKTLLRLENGDVKEELQEIRDEFGIETLYCHDDNTRVHRCIKLLQLKDCLTEIKEIVEKCCIMQTILDCENYDDCTQCGRISDGEGIQQIFKKISEVEDG